MTTNERPSPGFLAQFERCRQIVAKAARDNPALFDRNGKPIVAELRMPTIRRKP